MDNPGDNDPVQDLLKTTARLRSPEGGCPWDLAQSHQSLRKYLLEEVYEVLEAIDQHDLSQLSEELGDLLFQIVLHAQIAKEGGSFSFESIASDLNQKMIRRHPHVFSEGSAPIENIAQLTQQWDQIKQAEKTSQSPFASIPKELPSLARLTKILKKAQKSGLEAEAREKLPSDCENLEDLSQSLIALCKRSISLKIDLEDILRQTTNQIQADFEKKLCS
ncbi:MAG: MazG family protein [Candidatus Caenarcaniphilales bacterium]|nr:MazG family protein [Candidatus Caenarcaniphilales bacterium]